MFIRRAQRGVRVPVDADIVALTFLILHQFSDAVEVLPLRLDLGLCFLWLFNTQERFECFWFGLLDSELLHFRHFLLVCWLERTHVLAHGVALAALLYILFQQHVVYYLGAKLVTVASSLDRRIPTVDNRLNNLLFHVMATLLLPKVKKVILIFLFQDSVNLLKVLFS